VCRHGRGIAESTFPRVAAHLAHGCNDCAVALVELAQLLDRPDKLT
jgi:hypothetical protein